jgi:hypothetical protein
LREVEVWVEPRSPAGLACGWGASSARAQARGRRVAAAAGRRPLPLAVARPELIAGAAAGGKTLCGGD